MTTQTTDPFVAATGLTLTAKLFTLAAPDTEVTGMTGGTVAVTEYTNAKGSYVPQIVRAVALPAGIYRVGLFLGSTPHVWGYRTFAGTDGEVAIKTPEASVLDTAYLFDDGFGRKAIKANVTHYQDTLQGNGDLPAKLDAIRTNTNTDIPASINDIPTTAEFEARTLAAASYATAAQINSLQVNTRANLSVPIEIETPDSSTQVYKIRLFLFDIDGNMEAPDSTPTVALVNAAGTDRSSRLSSASNASTGVYSWDYTATDDDAEEQLNWTFTVVEGGLTRVYPATSYVVEETAYRFTSTDRSTLNSRSSQTSVDAISTKIGTPAGASVSADIAAVKTDTGNLVTRITSTLFSGITYMSRWMGALAGKTADTTTRTEINATTAGATYNETTDSQEAIRDRGDAAWTGSGGGSGTESDLMVSTTIATLTSQTVFTLTDGSADNDAYNDQLVVITDASTSTQKSRGIVSDYVGATKTVTLRAAPGFTIATGDGVAIIAIGSDVSSTQLAGAVSSAVATAGVATTVTGIPTFLRVGDARTVANGGAIAVRLYDADDDSLLFGLGTQLFADATITFSLRRPGNDGTEGAEEAIIPCTWVASGGDGYVQIAYEGDALDGCDAMDKVKEKDCHRWGIKFQWGDDDPITPVYGTVFVLRKIVSTQ